MSEPVVEEHEHEYLSQCCGKAMHSDVEGMCAQCRDWTGFECECGEVWHE